MMLYIVGYTILGGMALGVVVPLFLVWRKYRTDTLDEQWLKRLAWGVVAYYGLIALAQVGARYYAVASDPFASLMLPPHQSWAWFAQTALQKYIAPYIIAAFAGGVLYAAAIYTNRFFKGDLFVTQDKYLLLMAGPMLGWPEFVLYLGLVVVLAVVYSAAASLINKSSQTRVTLTTALITAAPLVFFFGRFIASEVSLWKLTI